VQRFLLTLKLCRSPNDTVWFVTASDFARKGGRGFRWNELEATSIEAAKGDTSWQNEIRTFWDDHLPLMLAVHSDYEYLALRISDGAVVHGNAPEFEETETVAPSFEKLLSLLQRQADAARKKSPWSRFLGDGS
jgi:hypothetical protein